MCRVGGGLVTKSCLTLCNPMDCSLPDSSVHGFSKNNTGVGGHSFSTGSSNPGISPVSPALQAGSLPTELRGKHHAEWGLE